MADRPMTRRGRAHRCRGVGDETQEIDNPITKQHEMVHTFGWYLRKYVADTHAKGATPIVCSLIPRKIWKDGKIVRNTDDLRRLDARGGRRDEYATLST